MAIHLYAEHLINIRALSIQASLATYSNKETKATISAEGDTLTLSHEGDEAAIQLPTKLSGGGDAALVVPAAPSKELTFRVRLEEKPDTESLLENGRGEGSNVVPWTAAALSDVAEICCRSCQGTIVGRGRMKKWKDLPSEGWAEMMEFWHCHKPNEPHSNENGTANKGYSANGTLTVEAGVGLVDTMSFLVSSDEVQNVKTRTDNGVDIVHHSCDATVGIVDSTTGGYKLRKPALSLSPRDDSPHLSYTEEKWLACLLLAALEDQGVRKFTLRDRSSSTTSLLLWIFAPNIVISSSAMQDSTPKNVVKVMWKKTAREEVSSERLDAKSLSTGEVDLPETGMRGIAALLENTSQLLPQGGRKFQDWSVALLERFTTADV